MWRIILRTRGMSVVDDFAWEHPMYQEHPPMFMEVSGGGRFKLRMTSERTAFYVQEPMPCH